MTHVESYWHRPRKTQRKGVNPSTNKISWSNKIFLLKIQSRYATTLESFCSSTYWWVPIHQFNTDMKRCCRSLHVPQHRCDGIWLRSQHWLLSDQLDRPVSSNMATDGRNKSPQTERNTLRKINKSWDTFHRIALRSWHSRTSLIIRRKMKM